MARRGLAHNKPLTGYRTVLLAWAIVLAVAPFMPAPRLSAAEVIQRSIRISDSSAAQGGVTYRIAFSTVANNLVGSVRIQFCTDSPLVDDPCGVPAGFNISNAFLSSQNGMTGFVISANTTANQMVIGRPPANEGPIASTYTFTGVTNPLNGGSLYARIYTYPTSDGTGPYTDAGGLALYFAGAVGISAEVPPFLRFCLGESITGLDCNTATDPFSDMGILTPLVTGLAQSQMIVATNADGGYSMWVQGGTMTSGNNTIPAMSGGVAQQGVSQFGINLRANTSPVIGQDPAGPGVAAVTPGYNQQNQFRFQSGDFLATSTVPDDNRKFTVSYIVNVAASQPGGVYATTLTYITLANF
jgi:hypothetical protein